MCNKISKYAVATAILVLLAVPAQAASSEWINALGPWFVPHNTAGNPAIGWQESDQYLYDPASEERSPDQYGTFLTTDFGQSWLYSDPDCIGREVVSFRDHGWYAWVCGKGPSPFLRRTTNGGQRWDNAQSGIGNTNVLCIDLLQSSYDDQLVGTTLYAGCNDAPYYLGRTIYKTTNGGESWVDLSGNIEIDGMQVRDVDVFQDLSGDFVALAVRFSGTDQNQVRKQGIYLSTDGGSSWSRIAGTPESFVAASCVAFSPCSQQIIYYGKYFLQLGTQSTVFKTTDMGNSWIELGEIGSPTNRMVVINSSENPAYDTVLVGTDSGLYYSTDGGTTWDLRDKLDGLCDEFVMGIAVDPQDHKKLALATSGEFFVTTDFGVTWDERTPERWNVHMGDISVNLPKIASGPSPGSGYAFSLDQSTDAGASWQFLDYLGGKENRDVAIDQLAPDSMYNPTYMAEVQGSNTGHWTFNVGGCPTSGTIGSYMVLHCIKLGDSFGENQYIYWGGQRGIHLPYRNFERRTASGFDWMLISDSWDTRVLDIDVIPTNFPKLLLAATDDGVYRSLDRGADESWFKAAEGLPPLTVEVELADRNFTADSFQVAYAGTDNGVYRTVEILAADPSTVRWDLVNYGMVTPGYGDSIVALVVHGADNSVVYAAVQEKSGGKHFVYLSADSARSWIDITRNLPSDYSFHDLDIHPINLEKPEDFSAQLLLMDTTYAASNYGLYKYHENIWPDQAVDMNDEIYHEPNLPAGQTTDWGPGLEIVHGDVIVPATSTLRISKPCTVLFVYDFDIVEGGASPLKSELIVEGKLEAIGDPDNPIVFMSSEPENPSPGDWYGIVAQSGSDVKLHYCVLKHADYGIKVNSAIALDVDYCTIEENYVSGVYMTSPSPNTKIRHSNIRDSGTYGIYANAGLFLAEEDTISGCRYGVYYKGDSSPTISGCLIEYPSSPISSYYGIFAESPASTATVMVQSDSIHGFDQGGIRFKNIAAGGIITNTSVVSCGTYGVKYESSQADISGGEGTKNHFEDNTFGLHLSGTSSPKVRRTKFLNNFSYGAYVGVGSLPDFGTLLDWGENSFIRGLYPSIYFDLYNANIVSVQAINNYWEEDPPEDAEIYNAIYLPYLGSDPLPKRAPAWDRAELAEDFELAKVFPNPFNPTTTISFNLSSPQFITVKVFNIVGQEVRTVFEGSKPAGDHTVIWDGRNEAGKEVAAGVYLVRLRTAEKQKIVKMTFLK